MARILFLGDRRIAWEALGLLAGARERGSIELPIIVTGDDLMAPARSRFPDVALVLDNKARHAEKLLAAIRDLEIEMLLSIQHNWILPAEILAAVKGKAFNLHNAKLPDYKGYNSISHALLNGDDNFVSTLHWMAEAVDSGPIAFEETTPILTDDTALSLYERTVPAALRAVSRWIEALEAGEEIPRRNMESGAGHFYGKRDIASYCDVTGITDSAERDRRIRATYFPPFNYGYETVDGKICPVLPSHGASLLKDALPPNKPDLST